MEISNDLFAALLVHTNILCLDPGSPYALEAHELLFPRAAAQTSFSSDPRVASTLTTAKPQAHDDLNCSNMSGGASTPGLLDVDVVSSPLAPDAARRLFVASFGGNTGTLTIEAYLSRLMRFGGNTARCCVDVAVILLQRLRSVLYANAGSTDLEGGHTVPTTGCSSLSAQLLPIPSALLFRAALAAFIVAIKLESDEFNSMKFYASVGGVTAQQLLRLERAFLVLIHYSVSITADDYRRFQQSLKKKGTDRILTTKCLLFLTSLQNPSSDDVAGSAGSGGGATAIASTNDDTVLDDSGYSSEALSVGNTSPMAR